MTALTRKDADALGDFLERFGEGMDMPLPPGMGSNLVLDALDGPADDAGSGQAGHGERKPNPYLISVLAGLTVTFLKQDVEALRAYAGTATQYLAEHVGEFGAYVLEELKDEDIDPEKLREALEKAGGAVILPDRKRK